jgi:tRNA1(Val) A37 N6-methylase TrmN6
MIVKEELLIDNLFIYQDTDLYRFTSDAIILSRFATAKKNAVVADICSGSGIVGIHFCALNKNKIDKVHLFEMQKPLYDLSVKTIADNNLGEKIIAHNLKIQDIGTEFNGKFSLVTCNPPYFKQGAILSKELPDHINVCREEITVNLNDICSVAKRLLTHGGKFCLVHRIDRLSEIMVALTKNKLEPKKLQFVSGGKGAPYLVLIEAVKGAETGLTVLPNLTNL